MHTDFWEQLILDAARKDGLYQATLSQCLEAEGPYQEILASLSPERQAQLERYIALCEELEHRKTQLALELPRA